MGQSAILFQTCTLALDKPLVVIIVDLDLVEDPSIETVLSHCWSVDEYDCGHSSLATFLRRKLIVGSFIFGRTNPVLGVQSGHISFVPTHAVSCETCFPKKTARAMRRAWPLEDAGFYALELAHDANFRNTLYGLQRTDSLTLQSRRFRLTARNMGFRVSLLAGNINLRIGGTLL